MCTDCTLCHRVGQFIKLQSERKVSKVNVLKRLSREYMCVCTLYKERKCVSVLLIIPVLNVSASRQPAYHTTATTLFSYLILSLSLVFSLALIIYVPRLMFILHLNFTQRKGGGVAPVNRCANT